VPEDPIEAESCMTNSITQPCTSLIFLGHGQNVNISCSLYSLNVSRNRYILRATCFCRPHLFNMPTLQRPRFKPSRAKVKTVSASSAKLENALATIKSFLWESSNRSVAKMIDETLIPVLVQRLALDKQRQRKQAKSSVFKIHGKRVFGADFGIIKKGTDEMLGSMGITWGEVQTICSNFDHDPNPDVASLSQNLKMLGMCVQIWIDDDDELGTLNNKNSELFLTLAVALVFLVRHDSRIDQSSAIVGFDDKNISIIAKRRNSTDTMSTVSMPPPPYGLVDWAETQRLRELMG
jgi:hypothetical protein